MQAHNHKNRSVCSIKPGQKQVPHVTPESDMLNALMFCCLLLVNKDLLRRSWTLDRQRRRSRVGSSSLERGAGRQILFPGSHAPTTTQGKNFDASFSSFFFLPSTTRRLFVFAWPQIRADLPETTDQHSASSLARTPDPSSNPPKPATFRPRRQFMYSSRRFQRLAVPDPPKLQPFRILQRPCRHQLTND
jgi:hypothetical protein